MEDLKRRDTETIDDYSIRVGYACVNKQLTWNEAADLINKEAGTSYGESKFRKKFKAWKSGYDYAVEHSDAGELRETLSRIRLEKVKIQDERTALNKLYRDIARAESVKQLIEDGISKYEPAKVLNVVQYKSEQPEVIVCLSDIHAGLSVDSAWNKYNSDIMRERLANYAAQIFNIVCRHQASAIRLVLLGDLINGHIHINSRIANNENTVAQIIDVSDAIANFIVELYKVSTNISVYSVSGNHSRIFPNKEECVAGDELDSIVVSFLQARLKDIDGVHIMADKIDPTFGLFECCGNLVAYAHGDKDTPANIVSKISMIVKSPVDIVLLGHRHTNGLTTVQRAKVIESGCVCGPDDYAVSIRQVDVPQQAVAVVNSSGIECLYDVKI